MYLRKEKSSSWIFYFFSLLRTTIIFYDREFFGIIIVGGIGTWIDFGWEIFNNADDLIFSVDLGEFAIFNGRYRAAKTRTLKCVTDYVARCGRFCGVNYEYVTNLMCKNRCLRFLLVLGTYGIYFTGFNDRKKSNWRRWRRILVPDY